MLAWPVESHGSAMPEVSICPRAGPTFPLGSRLQSTSRHDSQTWPAFLIFYLRNPWDAAKEALSSLEQNVKIPAAVGQLLCPEAVSF